MRVKVRPASATVGPASRAAKSACSERRGQGWSANQRALKALHSASVLTSASAAWKASSCLMNAGS